jgi:hypothetical protein
MSNPGQTPPPDQGSLLKGFLLGWAAMIAGVIVNVWFWTFQLSRNMQFAGVLSFAIGNLPWLAPIALVIWFASEGQPRSVKGVLLAFASLIGLMLLLVAACFGLVAINGGIYGKGPH